MYEEGGWGGEVAEEVEEALTAAQPCRKGVQLNICIYINI